jgi:uncharacterized membrane protein YhiD involved in acid resistance
MPDWLTASFNDDTLLAYPVLIVRLALALACGMIVAGSYRLSQGITTTKSSSLMATLVLLTILIAMVTLTIGNNVARAFSLVGALSIVRFRTVVEDTRDTAFVIFAVSMGMAIGAGYLQIPLIGIPITAFAAYLFRPREVLITPSERTLSIRIGLGRDANALLEPIFRNYLAKWELKSVATAKQGSALNLSYKIQIRDSGSAIQLATDLNKTEGVQEVDLNC